MYRQNVVLMVVMTMAAKRLPLDKSEVLPWLRGMFLVSNISVLCFCFSIHWKIRRKGSIRIAKCMLLFTDLLAADTTPLVYIEQQTQDAPQNKQITVYIHDHKFLLALYKVPLKGLLIVALMHFYVKSTKPLLLQSILPLKALWEADIFRVHIRGHDASGKLQRPWKKRKGPRQFVTGYVKFAVGVWKGDQTKAKSV